MRDRKGENTVADRGGDRDPLLWFFMITTVLSLVMFPDLFERGVADISQSTDQFVELQEGGNRTRQIGIVLLGVGGFLGVMRRRGRRLSAEVKVASMFFAIGIWCFLSILWSENSGLSSRRLLVMSIFVSGALAVVARWHPSVVVRFAVFGCAVFTAVGFVFELYHQTFHPFDPFYRFAGVFLPNSQGQVCAVMILAAIASKPSGRFPKFLLRGIGFMGLILLLLTRSRSSLAGLLVSLFVYWYIVTPKAQRWTRGYLGTVILLTAILLAGSYIPNVVLLGRQHEEVTTFTGRTPIWAEGLNFVQKRPLQGFGYEAFWTPTHIDQVSYQVGWAVASAHSAYIELLLDLGVIGLGLYLMFIFVLILRAMDLHRVTGAQEYALVVALVMGYVFFGAFESTTLINSSVTTFFSFAVVFLVVFASPKYPPTRFQRSRDSGSNRNSVRRKKRN